MFNQYTLIESIRQKLEDALEQGQLDVSDARQMMKTYRLGVSRYSYLNSAIDSQTVKQKDSK